MSGELLFSLRDVSAFFDMSHSDISRLLRRAGYKLPRVKRGQSMMVTFDAVKRAIDLDIERRTVRVPTRGK
jgi:hypothetical protein